MFSTRIVSIIFILPSFLAMGMSLILMQSLQYSYALDVHPQQERLTPKAPIVTSEGNVYVTWWSNKTGNNEVMFRASNDGGLTFGDKINLSNTTEVESVDAEIAAYGENVHVTWWERNQTANEPVLRTSNDAGNTFGPIIMLGQNGTLSITE